jgi:hypothetical protein
MSQAQIFSILPVLIVVKEYSALLSCGFKIWTFITSIVSMYFAVRIRYRPLPCMLKLFHFGKIEPMFRGVNFRFYWYEVYLTVVDVFQTKLNIMWLSET